MHEGSFLLSLMVTASCYTNEFPDGYSDIISINLLRSNSYIKISVQERCITLNVSRMPLGATVISLHLRALYSTASLINDTNLCNNYVPFITQPKCSTYILRRTRERVHKATLHVWKHRGSCADRRDWNTGIRSMFDVELNGKMALANVARVDVVMDRVRPTLKLNGLERRIRASETIVNV